MLQQNKPRIGLARQLARNLLKDSDNIDIPIKFSKILKFLNNTTKVSIRKLDADELDGINIKKGDETTIFYNKNKHLHRKRFTVAHELGHLVLGHTSDVYEPADLNSSKPEEVEANEFAAELLIPTKALKKDYAAEQDTKKLANKYLVSEEALVIKVKSCGLLSKPLSNSIWG